MNDLAEKALNGLNVARRQVGDRPFLSLSIAGFVLACVIVVAGGQVGAARATRPLVNWLGLQDTHGLETTDPGPGALQLAGIAVLLVLWLVAVEVARRTAAPLTKVWALAAAWGVPFAVGPPLMDTTAYSYAAFGLIQRHGRNPYEHGPAFLGDQPIVTAIDPGARGTPSSAGPLGSLLQHLALSISGGRPLGAVIVLRLVGILAAVAIGHLASQLAGQQPGLAVVLTTANPLVLLYVVSAEHLDGVMVALVLAALVEAGRRRWLRAIALACVAGSVTAQGFLAVPAIVVAHWLGRRRAPAWLVLGRDVLVAAGTTAFCGLVVEHGFGWVSTVSKQFSAHTPFAIATAVAKVLTPIVRGASYDDLAAGARITTMAAMACAMVYLLATARTRALERTVAYALFALAVFAPVLYPWYLLWGAVCLAPVAVGRRRIFVLAASAFGCLLIPPGFSPTTANWLTAAALVIVTTGLGLALRREPSSQRPDVMSRTAGRTSAR